MGNSNYTSSSFFFTYFWCVHACLFAFRTSLDHDPSLGLMCAPFLGFGLSPALVVVVVIFLRYIAWHSPPLGKGYQNTNHLRYKRTKKKEQ